jgi:adenylyltransferase/sulfurtransferase
MLSDDDLELFSRQLMLPDFSIAAQERLGDATVLIVGCGGLGNPLALYLAAAGVGTLRLADGDRVERSNLPRQILFGPDAVAEPKATAAARFLRRRYPRCQIEEVPHTLDPSSLPAALEGVTVVADGSDNYPTRYAVNRACIASAVPLVSAAAIRSEGQLATFDATRGTACYRCAYPADDRETALACRDSGVLGPVVGTLGTLQALEVIKVVTGWGEDLRGRMLLMDLARNEQRVLSVSPRRACPDCADLR